jgi:hypothetical protein
MFNTGTLWEADDHLLLVQSHGYTEAYRRFFYRDIQAIVICRTKSGMVASLVFGLLAAALGVSAAFVAADAAIPLWFFAGAFLFIALVSLLRGPTCRCTLRTAVQTQELPSLHHLRTARKTLRRIQPKIEAAQMEIPTP